jgi:hypothetical protein
MLDARPTFIDSYFNYCLILPLIFEFRNNKTVQNYAIDISLIVSVDHALLKIS